MSDNKALHGIGRDIVDAETINDLRAAALDALAEAHRSVSDRAIVQALHDGDRKLYGDLLADLDRMVDALQAQCDKLAARVAELEAALAEKHAPTLGQEWEIVLPMLGLTLRPRLDGVGVISATTTYTLNHPGGTPSPFERGVLLSGDSIGLGNDPVLSVCRILRSQT
jgi:hypothetical protein